jgi:hypothetical protein
MEVEAKEAVIPGEREATELERGSEVYEDVADDGMEGIGYG